MALYSFTEAQENRFFMYEAAFHRYDYFIPAEPIEGMEEIFLSNLKEAFAKVEEIAAKCRKIYGYRGMSKNLLNELHVWLPSPSFNVESRRIAELKNRGKA